MRRTVGCCVVDSSTFFQSDEVACAFMPSGCPNSSRRHRLNSDSTRRNRYLAPRPVPRLPCMRARVPVRCKVRRVPGRNSRSAQLSQTRFPRSQSSRRDLCRKARPPAADGDGEINPTISQGSRRVFARGLRPRNARCYRSLEAGRKALCQPKGQKNQSC